MSKLKAFTIMELIIVMLISIIIISISYKSYQIIEQQVNHFIKKNSVITENIFLKKIIYSSFDNTDIILKKGEIIECRKLNNNIRFSFYNNYVLYENIDKSIIDTFFVETQIVNYSTVLEPVSYDTVINSIDIDISNNNDTLGIYYKKEYSIEQLFKIKNL